jgi:hypothetical protein
MNKIPDSNSSVKAVRDARQLELEDFRLPTDGRKWKAVAKDRRAVFMELCTYADGDGSGACPGVKSLQRAIGSKSSVIRRLGDLKQLGLVEDEGKSRYQGTTVRRVILDEPSVKVRANKLRALRERRRKQEADGEIPPGSARNWEQLSRTVDHYDQPVWAFIDAEDAKKSVPMVSDSTPKVSDSRPMVSP